MLGSMFGTIICGFVLEKIDTQIVLISSMFFLSSSFLLIPFCHQLWQLFIVFFNNGIFTGFLVNAGNFFVIHVSQFNLKLNFFYFTKFLFLFRHGEKNVGRFNMKNLNKILK